MVAEQGDFGSAGDPLFAAGVGDGEAGEGGAVLALFGESSESEMVRDAGVFHLGPADLGKIAGDEAGLDLLAGDPLEQGADAGADFAAEVGAAGGVERLGLLNDIGHGLFDFRRGGAGVAEHPGEDVAVEHALDGDVVRGGVEAGDEFDGVNEHLAVVGTGLAHERAVDIEEQEGRGIGHFFYCIGTDFP